MGSNLNHFKGPQGDPIMGSLGQSTCPKLITIFAERRGAIYSRPNLALLRSAHSDYPPALPCRCRPRARASLRNRHQGPSIMGFEDEVVIGGLAVSRTAV